MSDWEIVGNAATTSKTATQQMVPQSDWEIVQPTQQQPHETFLQALGNAPGRITSDVLKGAYNLAQQVPGYYEKAKTEVPGLGHIALNVGKALVGYPLNPQESKDTLHALGQALAGGADAVSSLAHVPSALSQYKKNTLHLPDVTLQDILPQAIKNLMPGYQERQTTINDLFGQPNRPGESLLRNSIGYGPEIGALGKALGGVAKSVYDLTPSGLGALKKEIQRQVLTPHDTMENAFENMYTGVENEAGGPGVGPINLKSYPNKTATFFHVTSPENAEDILKNGIKSNSVLTNIPSRENVYSGTYTGSGTTSPKVLKITIPSKNIESYINTDISSPPIKIPGERTPQMLKSNSSIPPAYIEEATEKDLSKKHPEFKNEDLSGNKKVDLDSLKHYLPDIEPTLQKAKEGDYKSLRQIQTALYKRGKQLMRTEDPLDINKGWEMLQARPAINEAISNHFRDIGRGDLADKLDMANELYRKWKDTYYNKELPSPLRKMFDSDIRKIPKELPNILIEDSHAMNNLKDEHPGLEKALVSYMAKKKLAPKVMKALGGIGGAAGVGAGYEYLKNT